MATLVAAGIGMAVMIEEEAMAYLEDGKVAVWDEIVGTVDLNVVYNRRRENKAIIKGAIECIKTVWET